MTEINKKYQVTEPVTTGPVFQISGGIYNSNLELLTRAPIDNGQVVSKEESYNADIGAHKGIVYKFGQVLTDTSGKPLNGKTLK